MNALLRPLPQREMLIEDQKDADVWDAIRFRDLHRLNDFLRRHELRERLRAELQDEPKEPRWSAYDEETGIPKQGPL